MIYTGVKLHIPSFARTKEKSQTDKYCRYPKYQKKTKKKNVRNTTIT